MTMAVRGRMISPSGIPASARVKSSESPPRHCTRKPIAAVQKESAIGTNSTTNSAKPTVFSGFRPLICSIAKVRPLMRSTVSPTANRNTSRRAVIHNLLGSSDSIFIMGGGLGILIMIDPRFPDRLVAAAQGKSQFGGFVAGADQIKKRAPATRDVILFRDQVPHLSARRLNFRGYRRAR